MCFFPKKCQGGSQTGFEKSTKDFPNMSRPVMIQKSDNNLSVGKPLSQSIRFLLLEIPRVDCDPKHIGYPLINQQFAIENGPFIVNLPIKDGDVP